MGRLLYAWALSLALSFATSAVSKLLLLVAEHRDGVGSFFGLGVSRREVKGWCSDVAPQRFSGGACAPAQVLAMLCLPLSLTAWGPAVRLLSILLGGISWGASSVP
jgi:hypothetical protein